MTEQVYSPVLINAEEWARAHPYFFRTDQLDSIRPGDRVTIWTGDFDGWQKLYVRVVTERDGGGLFVGRIENYNPYAPSFVFGDLIRFGVENIHTTWEPFQWSSLDSPANEDEQ